MPLQAKLLGPLIVTAVLAPLFDRNEEACLKNAKMLGVGTMIYAADNDDALPFASRFRTSVFPYVKDAKIFRCPADASSPNSYFLDPRMSGKNLVAIYNPARTALLVEGSPKKTAFRHSGKAALVYTDGHAKMSLPAEVLKARTVSLK